MCGIAGEFALDRHRQADPCRIPAMVSALRHRGPDSWGYYVSADVRVTLAHARLSIIGLVGGGQPMSNENGTLWLSANGEIYDFERQRRQLQARGHRFRCLSDSEVILHLYEEYGDAFLSHLRGEFAFALFDTRTSRLLLVRDRFGIKPLYYAQAGSSLVFASELKAIFSHGLVTPEIDSESLYCWCCGILLPGATIFRGIKQVEPGCCLAIDEAGVRQVRYWEWPVRTSSGEKDLTPRLEREAAEEFGYLFEESVRLRLRSDVPVGVYLSGGVDSASVAGTAARFSGGLRSFTIGFDDSGYDESQGAAAWADAAGLHHYVVPVRSGELAPVFADALWACETPMFNSHGAGKFLLSKAASQHVKVVLTGEGADELLLGYSQFKHQALLEAVRCNPRDRSARASLNEFLKSADLLSGVTRHTSYPHDERVRSLLGAYPYSVLRAATARKWLTPLLSRELRQTAQHVNPIFQLASRFPGQRLASMSAICASQYYLFHADLPNYILTVLGDRMEMAHSVEGRVPFLDHLLVEFISRLPVSLLLNGSTDKYLLRRFVSSMFPHMTQPSKKVFLAPSFRSLSSNSSDAGFASDLSSKAVREAGIFHPLAVQALVTALRMMPRNSYHSRAAEAAFTGILSVQVLHRMFCREFSRELTARRKFFQDPAQVAVSNGHSVPAECLS